MDQPLGTPKPLPLQTRTFTDLHDQFVCQVLVGSHAVVQSEPKENALQAEEDAVSRFTKALRSLSA